MISWLRIDDTDIHHPVMQGKDNNWYKNHDWQDKPYGNGALFLDADNETNFSDDFNIIHGSELHLKEFSKFSDKQYFIEHQNGVLFVPSGEYKLHALAFLNCGPYAPVLDVLHYKDPVRNKNDKQFAINDILDMATYTTPFEDVINRIDRDKVLVVEQYQKVGLWHKVMVYLMEKVK